MRHPTRLIPLAVTLLACAFLLVPIVQSLLAGLLIALIANTAGTFWVGTPLLSMKVLKCSCSLPWCAS